MLSRRVYILVGVGSLVGVHGVLGSARRSSGGLAAVAGDESIGHGVDHVEALAAQAT